MLVIDLRDPQPNWPEGSSVGEAGLPADLFMRYWMERFGEQPLVSQYMEFQFSNIRCVHCRAGAVKRKERLIHEYQEDKHDMVVFVL